MLFESPLLTIEETMKYLKATKDTVYVLVRSKEFPAFKVGREWKIHKDKLDKWILDQIKNRTY